MNVAAMELHEAINRTVKLAMDSGEARSVEDAERIFRGYRLVVEVGPEVVSSPTHQAALLTAVNTGRRCFLGGVEVTGDLQAPLLVPWRSCRTLFEAVMDLRGLPATEPCPTAPRIVLGATRSRPETGVFAVRATFNGWAAGVVPLGDGVRLEEAREFTPAGVLSGALAVSEAFQHVRGGTPMAGRRAVGLSLWRPEPDASWLDPKNAGPEVEFLPSSLWLLGLGHLGQAFLWTLGLLPYAKPEEMHVVLQDFDFLSEANDSTSPLTFAPVSSVRKTRAMAQWCEARGFRTSIQERRFAGDFHVSDDEPTVALCGVDNAMARAALEDVGFSRVIEAGLGKTGNEYLAFQMHTFPGPREARDRWGHVTPRSDANELVRHPAYQALAGEGLDECGMTMLAGRTVGASFVGTVVSTLVVAELLRMSRGGSGYALVDGTLRSLDHREVVQNDLWSAVFNPGITPALEFSRPGSRSGDGASCTPAPRSQNAGSGVPRHPPRALPTTTILEP